MIDDRAERAFRDALGRAAKEYDVAPLGPFTSRPRRWLPAVLVAAVLVLVGSLALSLPGDRESMPASTNAPAVAADQRRPGEPPRGWHWESSLDVVVAVPDSWGYAYAPDDQWCTGAESRLPDEPFIDPGGITYSTLVACPEQEPANFTGIPKRFLRTHVSFPLNSDSADGTRTWQGWTQITRRVGRAVVQVLADEEHLDIARAIVDTAKQVDADANGCAARSPIQQGGFVRPTQPFDVTALASVDRIVICQYMLAQPGRPEMADAPGLLASREVTGTTAEALLSEIQEGRPGGGPDNPETCVDTMSGDAALTLLLTTGEVTREMYGYYNWCFGNGLDDGTTLRSLSPDNCAPLFGGRVLWNGGSGQAAIWCSPQA